MVHDDFVIEANVRGGLTRTLATIALLCYAAPLDASEPTNIPGTPWCVLSASSLERVLDGIDGLLETANRPELSDVFRNLQGLDQDQGLDLTSPLGMAWTWNGEDSSAPDQSSHETIVFLPFTDLDRLLKTVTLDSVPYRKVGYDHYEIDRPGSPYHGIVRDGRLWLGNQPAILRAISRPGGSWLRDLRAGADATLSFDFRQVPREVREQFPTEFVQQMGPLLQQADGEPPVRYRLRRRVLGEIADVAVRAARHTDRLTFSLKFEREPVRATITALAQAERGSSWNDWLTSAATSSSSLEGWLRHANSDQVSVLVRLPSGAGRISRATADRWSPIEFGFGFFGDDPKGLTPVLGLRWNEVSALCRELPQRELAPVKIDDETWTALSLEALPGPLRQVLQLPAHAWSQTTTTRAWLAVGPGDVAPAAANVGIQRLQEDDVGFIPSRGVLAQVKLPPREFAAALSGLLPDSLPSTFSEAARSVNDRLDGADATLTATTGRLTLRVHLSEGALRLVGHAIATDVSTQMEQMLALPPSDVP